MKLWPFSQPEPIETKAPSGTSVPADWMFELFGAVAVADYAVSGQRALEVPAVSSAINLISGSIAALGILVEKRDGDAWIAASEHPVARLLDGEPNDWSDTFTLVRDLVASALTDNEGGLAWVTLAENMANTRGRNGAKGNLCRRPARVRYRARGLHELCWAPRRRADEPSRPLLLRRVR